MKYVEEFRRGVLLALKKNTLPFTILISTLFYFLAVLLSFPQYSIQLLSRNFLYIDEAIVSLSLNTLSSSGIIGISLTVLYSLMTGIAVSGILKNYRKKGLTETKDLGALIPGLAAAGCASCGVGALALVGLGGSLALLPFNGNLIRLFAVGILVAVVIRNGSRGVCSIDG